MILAGDRSLEIRMLPESCSPDTSDGSDGKWGERKEKNEKGLRVGTTLLRRN